MITSLFRKSTPVNYAAVFIAAIVSFFLFQASRPVDGELSMVTTGSLLLILLLMLFLANFIIKRNSLSKDSSYTILFYLLFMLFFPDVMADLNLMLSALFVLLALRRLISLHTSKNTKEKIFDASLWICIAALFQFWTILFMILVVFSILFHAASDYRNWVLPFLAIITVTVSTLVYAYAFDPNFIVDFQNQMYADLSFQFFNNLPRNLSLMIFLSIALFFFISMMITIPSRPLQLQSSYQKIIFAFLIAVALFAISPDTRNELLIYTIAPLSFMATSHMELPYKPIKHDITLSLLMLCSLLAFLFQL
ncbi:MAG: hypothetical protein IR153_03455 [Flavobacterium sp.]|nr:hypothetical protein [Flavobacterium sp.]